MSWFKIVLKNENEKKNDLCGNKVVYKIKIDPYEVDLVENVLMVR